MDNVICSCCGTALFVCRGFRGSRVCFCGEKSEEDSSFQFAFLILPGFTKPVTPMHDEWSLFDELELPHLVTN